MSEVVKQGIRTKVLLLSATPVNNQIADLRNQISFIAGGLAYTAKVKGNTIEGTATSPSGTSVWRATLR